MRKSRGAQPLPHPCMWIKPLFLKIYSMIEFISKGAWLWRICNFEWRSKSYRSKLQTDPRLDINLLMEGNTYVRQSPWSTLLDKIVWRYTGAKQFCQTMLTYVRLQTIKQFSIKLFMKFKVFDWKNVFLKSLSAYGVQKQMPIKGCIWSDGVHGLVGTQYVSSGVLTLHIWC